MATAELALAIPAALVVLAVAMACFGLAVDQVRCVDAARAGARAGARGDTLAQVMASAKRAGPPNAIVRVSSGSTTVTVLVTVQPSGVSGLLSGVVVARGSATAERER